MATTTAAAPRDTRHKKAEAALTLNNLSEIGSILSSLIGNERQTADNKAKEKEKRRKQEKMEKAKADLLSFHKQQSAVLEEKMATKKKLGQTHKQQSFDRDTPSKSEKKPRSTRRKKDRATTLKIIGEPSTGTVVTTAPPIPSSEPEPQASSSGAGTGKAKDEEPAVSKDLGFDSQPDSDLSESANKDEVMVECETTLSDDQTGAWKSGTEQMLNNKRLWTSGMGDSGLEVDASECSTTADDPPQQNETSTDDLHLDLICPTTHRQTQSAQCTFQHTESDSVSLSARQPTSKKWSGNFRVQRMGWEQGKAGVRVHMAHVTWRLYANVQQVPPPRASVAAAPDVSKTNSLTSSYLDELADRVPELPSQKSPRAPAHSPRHPGRGIQRRKTTAGSLGTNSQLLRPRLQRQANVDLTPKPAPVAAVRQASLSAPPPGATFAFALNTDSSSATSHQQQQPSQLMLRRTNLRRQKSAPVRPASSATSLFHVRRQLLKRQTSQPIPRSRTGSSAFPSMDPPPEWTTITLRPTPLPKDRDGRVIPSRSQKKRSPSPPPFVHIVLKPIERVFDNFGRSHPAPSKRPIPPKPKSGAKFVPRWRRSCSAEETQ